MILDVEHKLEFRYSTYISESSMELRVEPTSNQHQTVRSFYIAVGPATKVFRYISWLGAPTHHFSITDYHDEIQVVSRAMVQTHPTHPTLTDVTDPQASISVDGPLADFFSFSELIPQSNALREFAEGLKGNYLGETVSRVATKIESNFQYRTDMTTVSTTTDEVLSHGYGVCQDFAQLMLGTLRVLGVPCRYISGYFHVEEPNKPSESHAWIEYYSPGLGWCGYDPTHGCVPDERHVITAYGRDYADAAPNRGVFLGNAKESLKAEVHTRVIDPSVAFDIREEIGRIDVPVYTEFPQQARSVGAVEQMVSQQ